MTRRVAGAGAACASVIVLATACSSGHHVTSPTSSATSKTGVTATRWWSNSQVQAGSTLSVGRPDAAAAGLHPSRSDYCGMLSQTLAAGKSILPGVSATDPALLSSTQAFVTELQHVAPAEVAAPWRVVGHAIVSLVRSGGSASAIRGVDAAQVRPAVAAIATDAKARCHVDLSRAAH